MIELILAAALSPMSPLSSQPAPVEPCVWPNTCAQQEQAVASFQPCGFPNKCQSESLASGPFQTCQWPNKCS